MKLFLLLFILLITIAVHAQVDDIVYPIAPKSDTKDTIWGVVVSDPYRQLEKDNEARDKWLDEEEKITKTYNLGLKHSRDIQNDINMLSYTRYNIPNRQGPFYIEQSHSVLLYKDYLRSMPEFLLDIKAVPGKATKFDIAKLSKDGKYIAFLYSNDGSDWKDIRVYNIKNLWLMQDHIIHVRYSNITWYHDGFFYNRFDSVDEKNKYTDVQQNQKVCYHRVGTDATLDSVIFYDSDNSLATFSTIVTDDERFIIITEKIHNENKTVTYLKDLQKNNSFKVLITDVGTETNIVGSIEDTLLAVTTGQGAYNGQIIEIDTKKPLQWGVVVENQINYNIKQSLFVKDTIFTLYQNGFHEILCVFNRNGELIKSIAMPYGSSNKMLCYAPDQNSIIIVKNYYISPPIGVLLSLKDFTLSPIDPTYINFDPDKYRFTITNYRSKDGTLIPIYIITGGDYGRTIPNGAILKVFGGFGVIPSITQEATAMEFINSGGIYAFADVRGGQNAVKGWHESGMGLNKQNTIDDIYYAARFLVDSGLANPHKIALIGSTNGGMVIAAAINQHPEMYRAAILDEGIYDMVRYENFTVGAYHTYEYGSIEDSIQFKNILSYSPLHNIKMNTEYPSILVTTSDRDDRMIPLHSYKYVAALQQYTKSKSPILLSVSRHRDRLGIYLSYGLSHSDGIKCSFLFKELNMKYVPLEILPWMVGNR